VQEFRKVLDMSHLYRGWSRRNEFCMKTRRDTLLVAASLALNPTSVKSSAFPDPVFGAIARHRIAAAAYNETPNDETHAGVADAFDTLCATEPTTLPGLEMLVDRLVAEFDGEWAGDIDAIEIALRTVRNALMKIIANYA
jgi:hypothetical protein